MKNEVKIRITGKNPRLYVKRTLLNKLSFHDFYEENHKSIIATISYDDYINLISKKTSYEIEVLKYYGPLSIFNYIKNNSFFVTCFVLSFIFLLIISNVVFDIDVIHNDKKIRELIYDSLKENNIKTLFFVPSYEKIERAKNEMIGQNKNDIEWLEIERTGSKLTVKVTERKINKKNEMIPNRHIVASKSGIIMKVEASKGVIMKKTNDYVSAGDIIVSGDIIKDETVKGQVPATGKVYAETWYQVSVEYPLYYEEVIYTSELKNNLIIGFFNKRFQLRKNYEESYLEKAKTLVKSKTVPFFIEAQKQRKVKIKRQKLKKDEAINKAMSLAEKKLSSKLNADEYIIGKKTLNFHVKDSKIEIDIFFKVCEDITGFKEVDNIIPEAQPEE